MLGKHRKTDVVGPSPVVYLVDDDEDFREQMLSGLAELGLDIHGFHTEAEFYRAYASRAPDIVILDVALEGEGGLAIARHLRASQSVGIVMAAARGAVEDRVKGLQQGVDAYLVKPIDIRELAATVFAVRGRLSRHAIPSSPPTPSWALVEGGWVLTDGLGNRLRLTSSEQRFLERLFLDRGDTVDRRALVEALGADVHDFNYGNLDTIASRLRRRAQKSGMQIPLHAVRGQGYAFAG